jgi:hypothetical protein
LDELDPKLCQLAVNALILWSPLWPFGRRSPQCLSRHLRGSHVWWSCHHATIECRTLHACNARRHNSEELWTLSKSFIEWYARHICTT